MKFEFATAGRILFGPGRVQEVGGIAQELGQRALLVSGGETERAMQMVEILEAAHIPVTAFLVESEPTVDMVQEGAELARQKGCDLVVGFGGGSALDTAKAIAALLANPGEVFEYLEVIGEGKKLEKPAFPVIAVPTTAGTGSEVTRNAVLASPEHQVKVSLRSASMLPRVALVDPELTYSLPLDVTASTGMDALTQVLEPYVSNAANPLTDAICREGMARTARSLLRAYQNGSDAEARQDMSLASLMGGLALANAKLGAVHGFAGSLGGMYAAPHGAVCAALLPNVVAVNLQALRERDPDSPILERYREVAQILTGEWEATAEDGVAWLLALSEALHIAPLAEYGVQARDFPEIIEKSSQSSSMRGNPIRLTKAEMRSILERSV